MSAKHELQRDLIALAGWPFYLLAFVRLLIGVNELAGLRLLAAALLFGAARLLKISYSFRAASSIVLAVIISDHYGVTGFTIIAAVALLGIAWSLFALEERGRVLRGFLIGLIALGAVYALVNEPWLTSVTAWLKQLFLPVVERLG